MGEIMFSSALPVLPFIGPYHIYDILTSRITKMGIMVHLNMTYDLQKDVAMEIMDDQKYLKCVAGTTFRLVDSIYLVVR